MYINFQQNHDRAYRYQITAKKIIDTDGQHDGQTDGRKDKRTLSDERTDRHCE